MTVADMIHTVSGWARINCIYLPTFTNKYERCPHFGVRFVCQSRAGESHHGLQVTPEGETILRTVEHN